VARIRTIKPEFPHSESMGRVSREARLCFVLLWTIADDLGRLRGNSRLLASLLYPYDKDAQDLMEGWLTELETEKCIRRYEVNGDKYIEVCNWLTHQKIDKPSKSKIPPFAESSRALANPREVSSGDQGSKDQGPKDQGKDRVSAREVSRDDETEHAEWAATAALYPPGAARVDWNAAEKAAREIVERGEATWTDLRAGVTRYATHCQATNRLVLNPLKFFTDRDKPWSQAWPIPPPRKSFAQQQQDGVADRFLRGVS
jgi:hypothetical protein